jgi:hypothetical protein
VVPGLAVLALRTGDLTSANSQAPGRPTKSETGGDAQQSILTGLPLPSDSDGGLYLGPSAVVSATPEDVEK